MTFVTKAEDAAVPSIHQMVEKGSIVHADEAAHWDKLAARFETRRVNHSESYSNGEQYIMIAATSIKHRVSAQWAGYWQRSAA